MPDILIKDSDWNSLSEEMQSKIANIISEQFPDSNIVPSPDGLPATLSESSDADIASAAGIPLASGADPSCVERCNSLRDVALAACILLVEPKAVALCLVGTQTAAFLCRSEC